MQKLSTEADLALLMWEACLALGVEHCGSCGKEPSAVTAVMCRCLNVPWRKVAWLPQAHKKGMQHTPNHSFLDPMLETGEFMLVSF